MRHERSVEPLQDKRIDLVQEEALFDSVLDRGARIVQDALRALGEPTVTEDVAELVLHL